MASFWWQRGRSPLEGGGCDEKQPTFKVFCRAHEGRCLAVRDGALVLAPADRADEHQHWFKDARLSLCIKDKEGKPVFSLVNNATGLAIQQSLGPYRPVRLVKFNPEDFDESVLWTESGHLGREFGCIRPMHNVRFGLDAFAGDGEDDGDEEADRDDSGDGEDEGDEEEDGDDAGDGEDDGDDEGEDLGNKDHGGATLVLSEYTGSDTQSWKIFYWNDEANTALAGLEAEPTCRIYCKADEGFSVTVRDGAVCLAPADAADVYQHWVQDKRPGNRFNDEDGYSAFALVNRVTGDAIRGAEVDGRPVELVPYNPFYLDVLVLWTTSSDMGHGFRCIHLVDNISLNLEALHGGDGNNIVLSYWDWDEGHNQQWKIAPWCPVVEDLESNKLELVSKGSEVENGEKEKEAPEKTDGSELLPLDLLRLR